MSARRPPSGPLGKAQHAQKYGLAKHTSETALPQIPKVVRKVEGAERGRERLRSISACSSENASVGSSKRVIAKTAQAEPQSLTVAEFSRRQKTDAAALRRVRAHFQKMTVLLGQSDELRAELRKQLEIVKKMQRQQEVVLCSLPSLAIALSGNCLTTTDFLPDNLRPLWDLVIANLGVYEQELGTFFTREMSAFPNQAQFRGSMLEEGASVEQAETQRSRRPTSARRSTQRGESAVGRWAALAMLLLAVGEECGV